MFDNKTIVAIATAQAAGGIGVIRVSGENATQICDKVFKSLSEKKLADSLGYRAYFGRVFDGERDIDECVALVFKAPHSYTGEDVVELSCHGGLYILKKVLRLILNAGAKPASAGEFTQRAFLNGRIDLTQAQAVMDLINAHAEQSASAALSTLDGVLSKEINNICSILISSSASLSAWVDYPDDEIEELSCDSLKNELIKSQKMLKKLINTFDTGKTITQGVNAAIVGKPNVGKSTLMNLLSGVQKSIVSEFAGTTRDAVEETVMLGGIVLHLTDTAGIRNSDDPIESIGVELAKQKLERATLVLAVFDSSEELDDEDIELLKKCQNKISIAIINKCDLESKCDKSLIKKYIENIVEISAKEGDGKDNLAEITAKVLGTDKIDTSSAMLMDERQFYCANEASKCVDEAINALEIGMTLDAVNVTIDSAIEFLQTLTGQKASESVVNEIFSKFCVGK